MQALVVAVYAGIGGSGISGIWYLGGGWVTPLTVLSCGVYCGRSLQNISIALDTNSLLHLQDEVHQRLPYLSALLST